MTMINVDYTRGERDRERKSLDINGSPTKLFHLGKISCLSVLNVKMHHRKKLTYSQTRWMSNKVGDILLFPHVLNLCAVNLMQSPLEKIRHLI